MSASPSAKSPASNVVPSSRQRTARRHRSEPRTFDFRRQSKLSREHVRTMQIVQETFARGFSTMLASQLRSVTQVNIKSIEQQSYDEYVRDLPNPTMLTLLSLAPLSGAAVFQLPLNVTFCAIELMLGGTGDGVQPGRPLTELELSLMRGIIDRALPELRYALEPVVATEPKIVGQESNPQFAQVAASRPCRAWRPCACPSRASHRTSRRCRRSRCTRTSRCPTRLPCAPRCRTTCPKHPSRSRPSSDRWR
jgi:flagellar motor switch protein FliM